MKKPVTFLATLNSLMFNSGCQSRHSILRTPTTKRTPTPSPSDDIVEITTITEDAILSLD